MNIILIKGKVKPIERREASSVRIINAAPIITSSLPGLPTRSATSSGGNNGKYIAAPTQHKDKNISIIGIP